MSKMINDIGDILETTEFVSEKIVYGTGINKNDQ